MGVEMLSAGFLRQKLPKRHEHLVEDCVKARWVLHVSDVLHELTAHWHHRIIQSWNRPSHPRLTLVPRQGGPFRRWWFVCPRCRRRCESLYVPPDVAGDEWRCRLCWGLIYASQRHGFQHPLRRVLTRRKRISKQRDVVRAERLMRRRQARLPAPQPTSAEAAWFGSDACVKRVDEYFATVAKEKLTAEPVQTVRISQLSA